MTVPTALLPPTAVPAGRPARRAWPVRVVGAVVSPRTWRSIVHVMFDFLLAMTVSVLVIALLSATIGLAVTVVFAIPPLVGTLLLVRLLGVVDRYRFDAVLGVTIANPHPRTSGRLWTRVRSQVLGWALWKELLYSVALLPLGVIGFSVVVGAWSGSLALVLMPAYIRTFPDRTAHFWLFDVHEGPGVWVACGIGALGLLIAPWVARGWAALDVGLGRTLLGRTSTVELEERVDTLETTRAWALEVAEAERRRIERDLHDGAQQRLVALAMDLGMAKEKMDTDPAGAKALVEEAHQEAKRAIVELRDLARGIHPVALGDRGLPGAIPAMASRCAIPVDVEVDVPRRPSPSIEGMAYFIVSECLTNAVKHSGASRVKVRVVQHSGLLSIEVTDDGVGGARPADGSGLRGLADRAASVDGHLDVSSPAGGPTVVRAELPCAS